MRQLTLTCAIILVVFSSWGQLLPTYYDTVPEGHQIVLSGNGELSATSLQIDLFSKLYRGGFITEEIKDNSLAKHGRVNRIGFEGKAELQYSNFNANLFGKEDWGYTIKTGAYYFGGALYSKDAFELGFYGNDRFVGDTADLSGLDLSFTAFQKVGFGILSKKNRMSVTMNVYNIQSRINGDFRGLEVHQSESGDTVQLYYDGEFTTSTSANFNQGIGLGFDVDYFMPFDWGNGKRAFIHFSLQNLGVAHLYEDQKEYRADDVFTFSGLRFNEIVGDDAIINDSLDVLDTLGISSGVKNSTFVLPGYIQVAKIVDGMQEQKVQSFFGVRLYPTLIYSPLVFAGINYQPVDKLDLGASFSYGGFTGFRGGIYASGRFGPMSLGLGTENLIGLVSSKGNGQSLYLRLSCGF